MDVKQIADKLEYLQVDVNMLQDLHSSDFMYFSQWLQELDKRTKGFEATLLKLEKTNQFAQAAAPQIVQVQTLSKFKIALAIGVGVAVGIKVNEALNKSKKEQ